MFWYVNSKKEYKHIKIYIYIGSDQFKTSKLVLEYLCAVSTYT
jgi:hypothetical protein